MTKASQEFFDNLKLVAIEVQKKSSGKNKKSKVKSEVLSKLIQDFKTIKEFNRKRVKELLSLEKEYSPLFCQISLFGTLDYGRLEVAHTRTIGWLISPEKEHGFGLELARSFLQGFGMTLPPEEELSEFEVETEKYLVWDENVFGRADIFISYRWNGERINILIETKVDSELTEGQVEKYRAYLSHLKGSNHVWLLTLNSDIELYEKFNCPAIGYEELYKCFASSMESLKDKSGFEFLKLYLSGVAKDLLNITATSIKQEHQAIPYSIIKLLGKR